MSASEYGDKWEKDKLNRKEDADYLSSYLIAKHEQAYKNINNGSFVLNINAEWGFGKTYFLKNWADDLSQANYPVVYFDAWKNDFSKEPLMAFISTINEQLSPYFDRKIGEKRAVKVKQMLKNWYESGKKLASPSSPIILEIIIKKLAGMSIDEFNDLMDDKSSESNEISSDSKNDIEKTIASVVSKTASKMMESHNSTKKTISDFKSNLGKLTYHLDSLPSVNLPMFIFIDELDRCRPNYAIEVLENIKHLFGVPGVFFIVATASEQLSHSIKAIYGQDFDSPNYLKRFFDQVYTVQAPDNYSFSEYLLSKYKLINNENLFTPVRNYDSSKDPIINDFASLTGLFNTSLRDMIHYCTIIESISLTFRKESIHFVYLLFLILLKDKNFKIYNRLVNLNRFKYSDLGLDHTHPNKNFTTYDNHNERIKMSYLELINEYMRLSKKDLPSIYNGQPSSNQIFTDLRAALVTNMPHSYNAPPQHYLLSYPSLIEQAGKLS